MEQLPSPPRTWRAVEKNHPVPRDESRVNPLVTEEEGCLGVSTSSRTRDGSWTVIALGRAVLSHRYTFSIDLASR